MSVVDPLESNYTVVDPLENKLIFIKAQSMEFNNRTTQFNMTKIYVQIPTAVFPVTQYPTGITYT